MNKYKPKIGDFVQGNSGYLWDPAEGIIVDNVGGVKIWKAAKDIGDWRTKVWHYSYRKLTKLPKNEVSWLREYQIYKLKE